MKKNVFVSPLLIVLFLLVGGCTLVREPAAPPLPSPLDGARQLLLVTSPEWNATTGVLRIFERRDDLSAWVRKGDDVSVSLGRSGLGWGRGLHRVDPPAGEPVKREGDGRAPAGIFNITTAFAYNDLCRTNNVKYPCVGITAKYVCVEDVASPLYNRVFDAGMVKKEWQGDETMLREDGLYQWGLVVAHNWDNVLPGAGSCIFFHIHRGPGVPTAGCTAMEKDRMESLVRTLDPVKKPLLVQLPEPMLPRYRPLWGLP